jgi:hypothetical protein
MNANSFVSEARKLKGARWRHRGRQPWAVDCVGLVVIAGTRSGMMLSDQIGYGREPWEDRLRKACRAHWGEPLPATEPKRAGDIALLKWSKTEPSHLAIIADHPDGGLSIIQAHNLHGVIECSLSGRYAECVVEVYRPSWGN